MTNRQLIILLLNVFLIIHTNYTAWVSGICENKIVLNVYYDTCGAASTVVDICRAFLLYVILIHYVEGLLQCFFHLTWKFLLLIDDVVQILCWVFCGRTSAMTVKYCAIAEFRGTRCTIDHMRIFIWWAASTRWCCTPDKLTTLGHGSGLDTITLIIVIQNDW